MVCSAWTRGRDLTVVLNTLRRGRGGAGTDLVTSDKTQGNRMDLSQGRCRLNFRRRFFIQRVFGHWNSSPGKGVTAPSLTELRKLLDNALRHLV